MLRTAVGSRPDVIISVAAVCVYAHIQDTDKESDHDAEVPDARTGASKDKSKDESSPQASDFALVHAVASRSRDNAISFSRNSFALFACARAR
jgi:hypothetical protein